MAKKRVSGLSYEAYKKYHDSREQHESENEHEYEDQLSFLLTSVKEDAILKPKEKKVLKCYIYAGDVLEATAQKADEDSQLIKKWIKGGKGREQFAMYWSKIKRAHESMVSSALWFAIKRGEPWAIKSYLSTHTEEFGPRDKIRGGGFDDKIEITERSKGLAQVTLEPDAH